MSKIPRYILTALIIIIGTASIWIFLQTPKLDRDWQEDTSRLSHIRMEGSVAHVYDVRDWRYNSAGVTQKTWTEAAYNSENISNVWLVVAHFSEFRGVAHTMFVFDFTDSDPVVISVEARREADEEYSALKGLFRSYELTYVWSTEKDALVRRAVAQQNDVYMYPLRISKDFSQQLFLNLVQTTNRLTTQPTFYNTLTRNCTNELTRSANRIQENTVPFHISQMLPGYSADFLEKHDLIQERGTDQEQHATYYVTDIIQQIASEPDFSHWLRKQIEGA